MVLLTNGMMKICAFSIGTIYHLVECDPKHAPRNKSSCDNDIRIQHFFDKTMSRKQDVDNIISSGEERDILKIIHSFDEDDVLHVFSLQ